MGLHVKLENITAYFGNVICPFLANYLDNDSIRAYHAYACEGYNLYNKRYVCYCVVCRIFRLLLGFVVGRQKDLSLKLKIKLKYVL